MIVITRLVRRSVEAVVIVVTLPATTLMGLSGSLRRLLDVVGRGSGRLPLTAGARQSLLRVTRGLQVRLARVELDVRHRFVVVPVVEAARRGPVVDDAGSIEAARAAERQELLALREQLDRARNTV